MSGQIAALALCVFQREDGALLVAYGYDTVKEQAFYRPLGGHIEFGERAEAAARREIMEELGAAVDGLRLLGVVENLFTFLGEPGHEIVWIFEARLVDEALYAQEVIIADEGGSPFEARWVTLADFVAGKAPLYPDGLLELLTRDS